MTTVVQQIITGILIAVLGLSGLSSSSPATAAQAAFPTQPTPVAGPLGWINARLERVLARQSRAVERMGKLYGQVDQGFPHIQKLLDKARALGLDTSEVQTALDAFKSALLNDRATYTQAQAIVNGHAGFDTGGKVTDATAAITSVQNLFTLLSQFRTTLGGTGKALQAAIQAFRKAHPSPVSK